MTSVSPLAVSHPEEDLASALMKLFLYELVSAGGLGPNTPESLRAEGFGMLSALVSDFASLPDVQTLTLLDEALPGVVGHHCRRVPPESEEAAFHEMVRQADAVVVIAPEFADLLLGRSRAVRAAGKHLLGCQPEAIALCGDKLRLADLWQHHGVPSPPTRVFDDRVEPSNLSYPAVLKPRHGAGSQATFLVPQANALPQIWTEARTETPHEPFILQPHAPGLPASVSFLAGPAGLTPLLAGVQRLSDDGRFRYLGGTMPLEPGVSARAVRLASLALAAVPGLLGFVGVDLVLGPDPDGSTDHAIEINPRVTTSYLGLRRLSHTNLAAALLSACRGARPTLSWRGDVIEFTP